MLFREDQDGVAIEGRFYFGAVFARLSIYRSWNWLEETRQARGAD